MDGESSKSSKTRVMSCNWSSFRVLPVPPCGAVESSINDFQSGQMTQTGQNQLHWDAAILQVQGELWSSLFTPPHLCYVVSVTFINQGPDIHSSTLSGSGLGWIQSLSRECWMGHQFITEYHERTFTHTFMPRIACPPSGTKRNPHGHWESVQGNLQMLSWINGQGPLPNAVNVM